jgi:hypothetical protein
VGCAELVWGVHVCIPSHCCYMSVCLTLLLHACMPHTVLACLYASHCCCMPVCLTLLLHACMPHTAVACLYASHCCCMPVCLTLLLHARMPHTAVACLYASHCCSILLCSASSAPRTRMFIHFILTFYSFSIHFLLESVPHTRSRAQAHRKPCCAIRRGRNIGTSQPESSRVGGPDIPCSLVHKTEELVGAIVSVHGAASNRELPT